MTRASRNFVVLSSLLVFAACGGESKRTRALTSNAASSPGNTGASGSGGAAGAGEAASFPAWPCPAAGHDKCIELNTGNQLGVSSVAVEPDGSLLFSGVGSLEGVAAPFPFISKYTPDLELVWFKPLPGGVAGVGQLATDADGNIFSAGAARATVAGSEVGTNPTLGLQKLSPAGDVLWTTRWTTTTPREIALAVGGDGAPVLGGYESDSMFLAKYSTDGDPLWDTEWSAGDNVAVAHVAVDADGNIFLTPSPPDDSDGNWVSANLEKHTALGDLEWSVSLDGTLVCGVAAGSSGDVFVLMNTPLSIAHYGATGDLLWARNLDDFEPAYALATDANGNAYAVGMAKDERGHFAILAEYSPDGDRLGSEELVQAIGATALSVAASKDGTAFVAGLSSSFTATFITRVSL